MYVTLLFDVEDIVAPEADDVALSIAELLTELGARATFCIVGERARQWAARGRSDVIAALGRHDVGFHTDLHSVHPTVAEYLIDLDWDDGVEQVVRREAPGVAALRNVFGVLPSCWGGPGNTWGPQVNVAMARLGIPAIVYAYTAVPDGGVHRFCDALCYPDGPSMRDGHYHDRTVWERDLARLVHFLADERDRGARWRQVFLGHPTRILHEEFWDGVNFAGGRNPPREEWRRPARKREADLEVALQNLERTIQFVMHIPHIEMRTIREVNALFESAVEQPLSVAESEAVWPGIEANLRGMADWPILPLGFDTAPILTMTRAKLNTLRELRLPAT